MCPKTREMRGAMGGTADQQTALSARENFFQNNRGGITFVRCNPNHVRLQRTLTNPEGEPEVAIRGGEKERKVNRDGTLEGIVKDNRNGLRHELTVTKGSSEGAFSLTRVCRVTSHQSQNFNTPNGCGKTEGVDCGNDLRWCVGVGDCREDSSDAVQWLSCLGCGRALSSFGSGRKLKDHFQKHADKRD